MSQKGAHIDGDGPFVCIAEVLCAASLACCRFGIRHSLNGFRRRRAALFGAGEEHVEWKLLLRDLLLDA